MCWPPEKVNNMQACILLSQHTAATTALLIVSCAPSLPIVHAGLESG